MSTAPLYLTAALYKFVDLPDFEAIQAPLQACCEANEVKGTLLLAHEGINGTVAGTPDNISALLEFLRADPRRITAASITVREAMAAAEVGDDPFAVVATHRHKDHISGFDPGADGNGAGASMPSEPVVREVQAGGDAKALRQVYVTGFADLLDSVSTRVGGAQAEQSLFSTWRFESLWLRS
mgnify:CR=1 FL=1